MNLEQHPAGIIRKAAERKRLNGQVPEGFVDDEPMKLPPEGPEEPEVPRRRPGRSKAAWLAKLIRGDRGPKAIEANVVLALRMDASFIGRIRFNELAEAVECSGLPWREHEGWRPWTDTDDIALAVWLQHRDVSVKPATCAAAVQLVATDNPCHPVRDYLDGLRWDGTPRLDGWLRTYLGVATGNAAYVREVGRRWAISAVARIYKPGSKADHVPILEGRQGTGKSSALAALVPDPTWFADEISDLGSKDAAQDLRGKWIIEIPELSAMRRSDIERTKAFVTRAVDHYRPSYGRRSVDHPRACVFCGTTNADAYLGDETGNRRFWPVKVGTIDVASLKRDRDQLWAEAVAAFRAAETWWLERDVERVAAEEQAERRIEDVWEAKIIEWAEGEANPFTLAEALWQAVGVPLDRQDRSAQMRGAAALKANGWQRVQRDRKWVYLRPETVYFGPKVGAGAEVGAGVGAEKTEEQQAFNQPHQPHQPQALNSSDVASDVQTPKKVGWCGEVGAGVDREARPDWQDSAAWLALFREAGTSRSQRQTLAVAWGEAAGCRVDTSSGKLDLLMPKDLADIPAKFALRKQAKDVGIKVLTIDPGARH